MRAAPEGHAESVPGRVGVCLAFRLEAFIRPGRDLRNRTSRASYAARGIVPSGEAELAFYLQHNCGYESSHVRGSKLTINFATSAGGGLEVEVQTPDGQAIEGFALGDCPEIAGDRIEHVGRWKGGEDLGSLRGRALRLRFVLRDADLYAIRFGD